MYEGLVRMGAGSKSLKFELDSDGTEQAHDRRGWLWRQRAI